MTVAANIHCMHQIKVLLHLLCDDCIIADDHVYHDSTEGSPRHEVDWKTRRLPASPPPIYKHVSSSSFDPLRSTPTHQVLISMAP